MSDAVNDTLTRAYELIESDQRDEARELLAPLLTLDDADVWWVYAHALTDADEAEKALQNVVRIDPEYPEATNLLQQLQEQQGTSVSSPEQPRSLQRLGGVTSTKLSTAELEEISEDEIDDILSDLDDDFLDSDEGISEGRTPATQENSSRRRLLPILAVLALLAALALAFILFGGNGGDDPDPTATTVAGNSQTVTNTETPLATPTTASDDSDTEATGTAIAELPNETNEAVTSEPTTETSASDTPQPTEAPSEESITTPTDSPEEPTTAPTDIPEEPTEEAITPTDIPEEPTEEEPTIAPTETQQESGSQTGDSAIGGVFAESFELASDDAVFTRESDLGETLLISVCSQAGGSLRTTLTDAMNTFAEQSELLEDSLDAVGIEIIDCELETTLNTIAVSTTDLQDFIDGNLSQSEFRGRWRAI